MPLLIHIFPSPLVLFFSGMLFFLSAAVVAMFQPYKVTSHNTVDTVLMILTGMFFVCYFHNSFSFVSSWEVGFFLLLSISLLFSYFISLLIWKLVGKKLQALMRNAKVLWTSITRYPREREAGIEEFDRDTNSSERNSYPPLLERSNRPTY
jgi:hypothetical protein